MHFSIIKFSVTKHYVVAIVTDYLWMNFYISLSLSLTPLSFCKLLWEYTTVFFPLWSLSPAFLCFTISDPIIWSLQRLILYYQSLNIPANRTVFDNHFGFYISSKMYVFACFSSKKQKVFLVNTKITSLLSLLTESNSMTKHI